MKPLFSKEPKKVEPRVPKAWVLEKIKLLRQKLPIEIQAKVFFPDATFYLQYYQLTNPKQGLHAMTKDIFEWLNIQSNGCIVDFRDEKEFRKSSSDAAGIYTRITDESRSVEVILINAKYREDPLAIGAVLAHEMMHLYLHRLGIELADRQENERLTDLATIEVGLGILILNGMTFKRYIWVTLLGIFFGKIIWRTEEQRFGYFPPMEYGGHALTYFEELHFTPADIIGYLQPYSRRYLPHKIFLRAKSTTSYIKPMSDLKLIIDIGTVLLAMLFCFAIVSMFFNSH